MSTIHEQGVLSRPLQRMDLAVSNHVVSPGEGLGTAITVEWLFPRVLEHMPLQEAAVVEWHQAVGAFKGRSLCLAPAGHQVDATCSDSS